MNRNPEFVWLGWFMILLVATGSISTAFGQTNSLRSLLERGDNASISEALKRLSPSERLSWLSEYRSSPAYRTASETGSSGGGAMADYSSLLQLIQNTIDGNWLANGGTSTLTPYPNGVRVSTTGVMERVSSRIEASQSLALRKDAGPRLDSLGQWQTASDLRWVSLHALDRQFQKSKAKGTRPNVSMELLGGLCRIDYLAYDMTTKEWLLGGPAGDLILHESGGLVHRQLGLPPVLLEDLLVVAHHIFNRGGDFGCTIDPDRDRLTRAYSMASTSASQRALRRSPDRWVEDWRLALGPQRAIVKGIPSDSPTGLALLAADAHMKRLGIGLEAMPAPARSYWQETELLRQRIDSGLVRWWFTLSNERIAVDPERQLYAFPKSNVMIQSEAQFINGLGERVVAPNPDLAADAFARNFNKSFEAIQKAYPVHGRLRHIFDLAVAIEIVRHEIEAGTGTPFVCLTDSSIQPKLPVSPSEIESIATTYRATDGTTFAVVSGGVTISLKSVRKNLRADPSTTNPIVVRSGFIETQQTLDNPEVASSAPKMDEPFWRD